MRRRKQFVSKPGYGGYSELESAAVHEHCRREMEKFDAKFRDRRNREHFERALDRNYDTRVKRRAKK